MPHALIVGTGEGISASMARALLAEGWSVALAGRTIEGRALKGLEAATRHACDAANAGAVTSLFADLDTVGRTPDFVLYNASARVRGPFLELDPAAVANALTVSAFGGFLVAQEAARRMVPKGQGAIFFTGASASVKGYAQSAPFAMGKFALRGLAQCLAREMQPKGIHVAHFIIDGMVTAPSRPADPATPDAMLDPDAIAAQYMAVLKQPRNAWSSEIDLRPWVETF
jgi:NAD(P)-dependent dehydrogenase (short-subunit alcohol dehydrogenase family)